MGTKNILSVFTFTMGRSVYLNRQIESIVRDKSKCNIDYHLCLQGCALEESTEEVLDRLKECGNNIHIHRWQENIGGALGINRVAKSIKTKFVMKLDDDAMIQSFAFFDQVEEVVSMIPDSVWSPYPVGLILNPGGVPGKQHSVLYSQEKDTYYTLRRVGHVGGFARVSPISQMSRWDLSDCRGKGHSGNEDTQVSEWCKKNKISMYYLENGLIVEHQESTLGQHERLGLKYFKNTNQVRGNLVKELCPPILYKYLSRIKAEIKDLR